MGLLLKGIGGPAGALILGGLGPLVLEEDTALFGDNDGPNEGSWLSRKKPWIDDLWWKKTRTFKVRAGILEINGEEIYIPTFNTISKILYDDKVIPEVYAEYKWSKRFKDGLKNILINALRVIRNDKGSNSE